jgi:hypothetical protein
MLSLTRKPKKVHLPHRNLYVAFTDRQAMKVDHPRTRMAVPVTLPAPPALPFDWSKAFSFPLDGNNIYGDCMMAAAEHGLNSGQIISASESGLPGVPAARIMDAMDIDTTDPKAVQTAIWLFGGVFFMLDIPDTWTNDEDTGAVCPPAPTRTMDTVSGGTEWMPTATTTRKPGARTCALLRRA